MKTTYESRVSGAYLKSPQGLDVFVMFNTEKTEYNRTQSGILVIGQTKCLVISANSVILTEPSSSHGWDAKTHQHQYSLAFSKYNLPVELNMLGELEISFTDGSDEADQVIWKPSRKEQVINSYMAQPLSLKSILSRSMLAPKIDHQIFDLRFEF